MKLVKQQLQQHNLEFRQVDKTQKANSWREKKNINLKFEPLVFYDTLIWTSAVETFISQFIYKQIHDYKI